MSDWPTKIAPVSVPVRWPSAELQRAQAARAETDRAMMDVTMYGERSTLAGLFSPSEPVKMAPADGPEVVIRWADGRRVRAAEDYPGGASMKADGWEMLLIMWDPVTPRTPHPMRSKVVHVIWERAADGGRLSHAKVRHGRWQCRVPTNRKRKRARCKTRRRAARARRGAR